MCVVHNAFCQDSCLADEGNTDTGSETAVRDVVNSFNILDHEVFHLVGGNDDLSVSGKALDDGG